MSRRTGATAVALALAMSGIAACGGGGGESTSGAPGGGGGGEDAPFYKECIAAAGTEQEKKNCERLKNPGGGD